MSITDSKQMPFKLNENMSIIFNGRRKSQFGGNESEWSSRNAGGVDSRAEDSKKNINNLNPSRGESNSSVVMTVQKGKRLSYFNFDPTNILKLNNITNKETKKCTLEGIIESKDVNLIREQIMQQMKPSLL